MYILGYPVTLLFDYYLLRKEAWPCTDFTLCKQGRRKQGDQGDQGDQGGQGSPCRWTMYILVVPQIFGPSASSGTYIKICSLYASFVFLLILFMQYFKVMLSRLCYIIQAWFMIGNESVWKCSRWIHSLLFQKPVSNIIVNLELIDASNQSILYQTKHYIGIRNTKIIENYAY